MKHYTLLAATLTIGVAVLGSGNVKAEKMNVLTDAKISAVIEKPKIETPKVEVKPELNEYIVIKGDSLSKIAKAHTSSWKRLFDKNLHIAHPDQIKAGDKLTIPRADEVLAERSLPVPPAPPEPVASVKAPAVQQRGVIAGNTYSRGYCTWHVKNMRPDLPNNLGNADTWYARARAQGIPTGTTPRVGAAGMTKAYMHVVYITAVNGSKVTVSEMNYRGSPGGGFGKVSSRVTNASEFLYLY